MAAQGVPNGVLACYDQVQFEAQPAALPDRRAGRPVGKVSAPIKTSYGYQVVRVVEPGRPALHGRTCSGSCRWPS